MEFVAVSVGQGEIFKLASFSPNVRAAEGKRSDRSSNEHLRLGVFAFDGCHPEKTGQVFCWLLLWSGPAYRQASPI